MRFDNQREGINRFGGKWVNKWIGLIAIDEEWFKEIWTKEEFESISKINNEILRIESDNVLKWGERQEVFSAFKNIRKGAVFNIVKPIQKKKHPLLKKIVYNDNILLFKTVHYQFFNQNMYFAR